MSSGRPVIGITCYVEPASRGDWSDVVSALLPHDYVRAVERAGGIAVLIPPRLDADLPMARAVLARVDGLLLAGGADVEPGLHGAAAHPSLQSPRPDRDVFEMALARAAAGRDLPTLGICRGMQVMAVAEGGHLEQHVPDRVGHHDHAPAPGVFGSHVVRTAPRSRVFSILGPSTTVQSYHHQAVTTCPGFAPSAWADDGTLEALEDSRARFRIGVQWHPEAEHDNRLVGALVHAARDDLG